MFSALKFPRLIIFFGNHLLLCWGGLCPPLSSSPWLSVVVSIRAVASCPPHPWNTSIVILAQFLFRESSRWGFMVVASDIFRRHNLTTNSLVLTIFLPSVLRSPSLRCRSCAVELITGIELCSTAFWLVVIFYNGLHLLQTCNGKFTNSAQFLTTF